MSSCCPSLAPSVRPLSSAHRRISAFCSAMLVSSRFVIVICLLHGGVPLFVARPAPHSSSMTRGPATASSILVQLWLALDVAHPLTHRGAEGSRP